MLWRMRQRVKAKLSGLSCRYFDLYPDPPITISDLGNPLGLIKRLGLQCAGVIHVGANLGQESDSYRRAGVKHTLYIEPIPEIFEHLKKRVEIVPGHRAIMALCSDREDEEYMFNVASNTGQSSSIFEFGTHRVEHPDVSFLSKIPIRSKTLDRILFDSPEIEPKHYDCLVMDVQGAELKVIRGAHRTLSLIRFVFAEVSEDGLLYAGGASFDEIIAALRPYGFVLKALDINQHSWGNAFFVKP